MHRLVGCMYTAVAVLAAQQVAPAVLSHIPTAWGHDLTRACQWAPRPWTRMLGPRLPVLTPDDAGRRAEWICLRGRGLKSLVIFGAQISPQWPDRVTIAKWEAEDEARPTPRPDWKYTPEPE